MTIQVLGSGCPTCKRLFELTREISQEIAPNAEVEYVTDIQRMLDMGIMQSPVLAINGVPAATGTVPAIKIRELITEAAKQE